MIKHTLGLQRCMFRGFNALALFSLQDKQILSRLVIPSTRHLVFRIRADINKVIREISDALGGKSHVNPPMQAGYEELLQIERDAARLRRQFVGREKGEMLGSASDEASRDYNVPSDVEKNLASITQDFLEQVDPNAPIKEASSPPEVEPENALGGDPPQDGIFLPEPHDPTDSIQRLKRDFITIQKVQTDILHSILAAVRPQEGETEMGLRMEEKLPSLRESWGLAQGTGDKKEYGSVNRLTGPISRRGRGSSVSRVSEEASIGGGEQRSRGQQKKTTVGKVELEESESEAIGSKHLVRLSRALATVYSLHFSTE